MKQKPSLAERLEAVKLGLESAAGRARSEQLERAAKRMQSDLPREVLRFSMRFDEHGFTVRGVDEHSERVAEALGQETIRKIYDALRSRSLQSDALRNVDMRSLMRTMVADIVCAMRRNATVQWE